MAKTTHYIVPFCCASEACPLLQKSWVLLFAGSTYFGRLHPGREQVSLADCRETGIQHHNAGIMTIITSVISMLRRQLARLPSHPHYEGDTLILQWSPFHPPSTCYRSPSITNFFSMNIYTINTLGQIFVVIYKSFSCDKRVSIQCTKSA